MYKEEMDRHSHTEKAIQRVLKELRDLLPGEQGNRRGAIDREDIASFLPSYGNQLKEYLSSRSSSIIGPGLSGDYKHEMAAHSRTKIILYYVVAELKLRRDSQA
jgi:hypothetical protein